MSIKTMFKSLTKKTKVIVAGVAVVAAIAVPAAVYAGYGPNGGDRKIYDFSNPAEREGAFDGPRFNSYINTNVYGDERAFLDAKECPVPGPNCYTQGPVTAFKDQQPVQAGKEYVVRAYVHNIANPSLNASGKGVAKNARIRMELPEAVGNDLTMQARISADNSIPTMVYDTVNLKNSNQAFVADYVEGSATIYNRSHPGGLTLSDNIMSDSGTLLGSKDMDGKYPGCFEYSAFVVIRVKIKAPKLEVNKQVTKPGSNVWKETMPAKTGETVSWLVSFQAKEVRVDDVIVRDTLPEGVTLVPGSIVLYSSNYPSGKALPDSALSGGGSQVGDYLPDARGSVRFRTTVDNDPPEDCKITNVGWVRGNNVPQQSADASITIEDCKPDVDEPDYACDLLTVTKTGTRKYRFTTSTTATNGATVKLYKYNFGDNSQVLVTDKSVVEHTYANAGDYETSVKLVVDVNGDEKIVDSSACSAAISISDEPETPTTPGAPTKLPDTGAGDLIGIFTAVSIAGTVAYRFVWIRRQYN